MSPEEQVGQQLQWLPFPSQRDIEGVLGLAALRAQGVTVVLPPSCIQLYMECCGLVPQTSAITGSHTHCAGPQTAANSKSP